MLQYPEFWNYNSWQSILLTPFSYIVRFISYIKIKFVNPCKLPSLVICVGNATVGGTGKTQIVIWLIDLLRSLNLDFIVVVQAYKASLTGCKIIEKDDEASLIGDESKEIFDYANASNKVIATKKWKYSIPLLKKLKPQIIILDDAMQNPYIKKDINILTIDCDRKFGNRKIIPAGPLREKISSAVKKSDLAIAVTINDMSKLEKLPIPMFEAKICGNKVKNQNPYYAFSGIGNNERFFSLLRSSGYNVVGTKGFADHYKYKEKDLNYLNIKAKNLNARLITTRKDYVKIYKQLDVECYKVKLHVKEKKLLTELLYKKLYS